MLLIRIKTVLGHLSSLQSSSSRKGITLESNPELPQFPGFTKSAQHCKLSLFCHIAFLKSISYEVSSDSLHSHDFLYVPAESSPEHLAKQTKMEQDSITALTLLSSMELATPQTGFLDSAQQVHSFWNDSFMEHEKVHMAVKYPSHILQRHEREVQTYAFITE